MMTDETQITDNSLVNDILSTPALKLPPTVPEAHQGKIDGVTFEEFESGACAIQVALTSANVPTVSDRVSIFIPRGFADDIHVDPTTLPADSANKNNQQQQYAIGISNSDHTATLEELRRIAYEQGRSTEGVDAPTNIEEFVSVLNHLLVDVSVVFTRRPNTTAEDPRFRNRLQGSSVLSPNTVNNPKALKKYTKMWVTE